MNKLLSFIYISLVIFGFGAKALAVEYGGVGASPANPDPQNPRTQSIFVYNMDAGAAKQDAVRISNNSDTAKTIAIDIVDSETSSGGALACKQTVEPKKEVGSWAKLVKNHVTLPAHKSEVVTFELAIPKNASVGEHNGCLVVQDASASPQKSDQPGVSLSFRSALRMAVTVKGDVRSNLRFVAITHSIKGSTQIIHPFVKNEGNVSVDASINVAVKNIFGRTIATTNGSYPILAQSTADWNFEVKKPFWGGYYKITSAVAYPSDPTKALGVSQEHNTVVAGPATWLWISPSPVALALEVSILLALVTVISWFLYRSRVKTKWHKYQVKEQDTIQSLAKNHGVNWRRLAHVNKIRAPYELETGSWMYVPKK